MNIGIVGPPARISGSTKILFNQCKHLADRGHGVNVVLQKKGLENIKSLYSGLLGPVNLIELDPVPLVSKLFGRITYPYRTMYAGASLPVSSTVWYREVSRSFEKTASVQSKSLARTIDLDIGAMIMRAPRISATLRTSGCRAIICNATLMTLPVLPLFRDGRIKRMLYLFDMPISRSLVTEGRSRSSTFVRGVEAFEKWVVRNVDSMACMNTLTASDWRDWFGVKLTIVPPGSSPVSEYPAERGNYALTVTYWNPDKRPGFFLDLAEQLRNSDMRILMAGHWPIRADLDNMRQQIKEKNLQNKLLLLPDLTEEQLRSAYSNARCFIAPPKGGGYLMGAVEAAEVGTPIIYPKEAGAWDIFDPGVHGFIADPADTDTFSSTVRKFEEDQLVREMGIAIWERAKQNSWDAHCETLERLMS